MKRSPRLMVLTVLAVAALSVAAAADEPAPAADPGRHGMALGRLKRCLSIVDLSSDQKAAIRQILSDAKPTLQADIQAVHADHQKLETDIANGADKSVVGQDALTRHADTARLRSDVQAVRNQILTKLTTDQQSQVKGCFDAIGPNRRARPND